MSFGTKLQALRHKHGITQEQFAQQLNVSRQAVSKWESSHGYPELEKILYICNHYHVTMDELFADELPAVPVAGGSVDEQTAPEEPGLKQSFGNFFINLSPKNQWAVGSAAISIVMVLLALFFLLCTTLAKGASDDMTMKIAWLALLILFSVGEAITVGLTCVWFAIGALGGLVTTLLGGGIGAQITVFLVLSGLSLALVRPLAKKFLVPSYSATNADRVIGKTAVVTLEIDNLKGQGQVGIAGQSWTACSEDGCVIPAGKTVKVLHIEGVKVFVAQPEE
ncbi:MAG: helix-turn-helix domain-containing protein [Oscillospiraceae bacterium]|nr:helix-turn-helix domain-containing protein [Oscillospiraceae bacterium]